MKSCLIVSNTENSIAFIIEMLSVNNCNEIVTANNCQDARRIAMDRDFDLCIVNCPLKDETGEAFSKHMATNTTAQVIMIVRVELADAMSQRVEDYGICVVSKPISRGVFWTALKMASAMSSKMNKLRVEQDKLIQRIEDIRIVDRAKCLLIQCLKMSEKEAHKYIEKTAMDMRLSRREVAMNIIKTYEN